MASLLTPPVVLVVGSWVEGRWKGSGAKLVQVTLWWEACVGPEVNQRSKQLDTSVTVTITCWLLVLLPVPGLHLASHNTAYCLLILAIGTVCIHKHMRVLIALLQVSTCTCKCPEPWGLGLVVLLSIPRCMNEHSHRTVCISPVLTTTARISTAAHYQIHVHVHVLKYSVCM